MADVFSVSELNKKTITSLPLSRVLRLSDYDEMPGAVEWVDRCQAKVIPPHPLQHVHRRWEQALAWATLSRWMADKGIKTYRGLKISDWGCGVGLLPAMCVAAGAEVHLIEPWQHGDESAFVHRQILQVSELAGRLCGTYRIWNHPCLCELDDSYWEQYDVSFCISTLEHIGAGELAFRQLCKTVRPGGMIFLTMDYADSAGPHQLDQARAQIFTEERMRQLGQWGSEMGFSYLGGTDWKWKEECRIVLDYSFGSIAMVRS
jgi:SAM-dependent methyltransferase